MMDKDWKPLSASLEAIEQDLWLTTGRGQLITTINIQDLSPSQFAVSSSEGYALLTSYNWLKSTPASIYVPGGAPILKPSLELPLTIPKDAGGAMIDANAAKWPASPFEPVFRAMAITNPGHRFSDTDVLINRNTLRKFFDICQGRSPKYKMFRLNLFVKGRTLIIERVEQFNIAGQQDTLGYGKNFEHASTKALKGMEDSECHHRVIEYNLGDLKCAVRFEADACISAEKSSNDGIQAVSHAGSSSADCEKPGIKVVQKGCTSHEDSVVEIKTKKDRAMTVAQNMPQLWFGRVRYLVQGIHNQGTFNNVKIEIVDEQQRFEA